MHRRIHILGASGTGTSTLARGLASALGSQVFDTDDFYWRPTDPPFVDKRPVAERLDLMQTMFLPRSAWVLSGSLTGWGDPVIPRLTHVIFLTMEPGPRLARLRRRERQRQGDLIAPGGPRERAYRGFLDWAMAYDDPEFTGRSRAGHEAWLDRLTCPVIRFDGELPPDALLTAALKALDRGDAARTPGV